ncbi:ferrochelatase [Agrilactobacillus composti DSM 18527 = JCM 14202]|uniref:Coproporphyrin III ferrochelatase n=1 Tax=Agrilactobacillus composti DSM 18527 = JCM 14202 TaxID=1423734 RepID=A0A0R1XSQ0_9LACO|nr:ferrochelatase [Agrilactobacillus composti DSM 18527 = JCM 14202]
MQEAVFLKKSGVLLINLGTPKSAAPKDVRQFLSHFLSDPRVIDMPRAFWWLILHGMILPFRPKHSAKMYAQIWDPELGGSPLLYYTQQVTKKLQAGLLGYDVRFAMSYSQPNIAQVLQDFNDQGIEDLTIVPMYPQFSTTTVGSVYDAVAQFYLKKAHIPHLHIITDFYQDARYIQVLANTIQQALDAHPQADELLFSYHGIPQRYVAEKKDPYFEQCHITTEMTMERLDHAIAYEMTFQSKFGPGAWLTPATQETVVKLAQNGAKELLVVTPSFTADCLETLYEIDTENRHYFLDAGGSEFHFIAPLNDNDEFVDFLAQLVRENSAAQG